jgi:hypothetical protein
MNTTVGYFWLRFGATASVSGGASTAKIASKPGKVQGGGAGKGLQIIEGYTIRIDAKVSMGQTVASFKAIAPADMAMADAISMSFYPDMSDPKKPSRSFASQDLAIAEKATPDYTNWAKGGVVVLVSVDIKQS